MPIPNDQVEAFAQLFQGRRDAYGLRHGESVKAEVNAEVYRGHLEGTQAIGVYPVKDDGTCHFAAVDFDRVTGKLTPQEVDAVALNDARRFMDECSRYGLNRMYLERSKSKGAHAWAFFAEPVSCVDVRRLYTAALEAAGINQYELFPKQDKVTETSPLGNYINLPYPGGDNHQGRQMILNPATERPVLLADFLDSVTLFDAEDLAAMVAELPPEKASSARTFTAHGVTPKRPQWWPCTSPLLNIGLHEGEGRNELGLVIARRLQTSPLGDQARVMYDAWNAGNVPPLPEHEAERTWDSAQRYEGLFCEKVRGWQGPDGEKIQATCIESCIIHPNRGNLEYARLRKWETEPPTYFLAIGGQDIRLTSGEAWAHKAVRLAAFSQLNEIIPPVKPDAWLDKLQNLLTEIELIPVPFDATERGQIWIAICDWLRTRVEKQDAIETKPVEHEGTIYFKLKGLRAYLKNNGLVVKPGLLWEILRAHGATDKNAWLDAKQHRVWSLDLADAEVQP